MTTEVRDLPIDLIEVEQDFNPRTSFEITAIEELPQSIPERGVLQPITVRQEGEKYILISGERRLRAANGVVKTIPAIVQNGHSDDAGERLVDALIENLQRQDITIGEEIHAYRRLKDDHGWNAKRFAHQLGLPHAPGDAPHGAARAARRRARQRGQVLGPGPQGPRHDRQGSVDPG